MGDFTAQLEVYVVPGKCSPAELKGIGWLVFPFFLKNSWYNASSLQGCWEKINKQTPLRLLPTPIPSSVIFQIKEWGKGAKEQSLYLPASKSDFNP